MERGSEGGVLIEFSLGCAGFGQGWRGAQQKVWGNKG